MAQRRMFSPDIVCSDAFLDLPASSRDLYYQLGMYADDDGFVNPRKIMRMLGSSEDDLKLLIAKRFLLPFPSGVVVIKHWKINNLVRKDWYRPTQYIEEKSTLFIKENNAYSDVRPQFVNESLTQVRLGKVINTLATKTSHTKNMDYSELNDGEITYQDETTKRSKKYGNKQKIYTRVIKYYMQLLGKTGDARRHLIAMKEIFDLYTAEFPKDSEEEIEKEIKGRIDVAYWHYSKLKIKDWGLGKVAENWKLILDWNKEKRKHQ